MIFGDPVLPASRVAIPHPTRIRIGQRCKELGVHQKRTASLILSEFQVVRDPPTFFIGRTHDLRRSSSLSFYVPFSVSPRLFALSTDSSLRRSSVSVAEAVTLWYV